MLDKKNDQPCLLSRSPILSIAQFPGNVPLSTLISLECELYKGREYDFFFFKFTTNICSRLEIAIITLESGDLVSIPFVNYLCDLRSKEFNMCSVDSTVPATNKLPGRM